MSHPTNPIPQGPYFSKKAGLSYVTFGELLRYTRELGHGRYPIEGLKETFHLVLYEDNSWRISTPQLEIFPEQPNGDYLVTGPHTLT